MTAPKQKYFYGIIRIKDITPDEVKDRVAVRHGYDNWDDIIFTASTLRIKLFENEAMQEYAEEVGKNVFIF